MSPAGETKPSSPWKTAVALAEERGFPERVKNTFRRLLATDEPIGKGVARLLEGNFGHPYASFWIEREKEYRNGKTW